MILKILYDLHYKLFKFVEQLPKVNHHCLYHHFHHHNPYLDHHHILFYVVLSILLNICYFVGYCLKNLALCIFGMGILSSFRKRGILGKMGCLDIRNRLRVMAIRCSTDEACRKHYCQNQELLLFSNFSSFQERPKSSNYYLV